MGQKQKCCVYNFVQCIYAKMHSFILMNILKVFYWEICSYLMIDDFNFIPKNIVIFFLVVDSIFWFMEWSNEKSIIPQGKTFISNM